MQRKQLFLLTLLSNLNIDVKLRELCWAFTVHCTTKEEEDLKEGKLWAFFPYLMLIMCWAYSAHTDDYVYLVGSTYTSLSA